MSSKIPTTEEWEEIARRFYNLATSSYFYQFVRLPAYEDPPGALVKSVPEIDMLKVGAPFSPESEVVDFDDDFSDENLMNSLVKSVPEIEILKVGAPLPPGSEVVDFDDVFSDENAMNLLMSWAVSLYYPEYE